MEMPEMDFWQACGFHDGWGMAKPENYLWMHLTFAHLPKYHGIDWRCTESGRMFQRVWLYVIFGDEDVADKIFSRTYVNGGLKKDTLDEVSAAAAHTVFCYPNITISPDARRRLVWLTESDEGAAYKANLTKAIGETYRMQDVVIAAVEMRQAYARLTNFQPRYNGGIYKAKPQLVSAAMALAAVEEAEVRAHSMRLKPRRPDPEYPPPWLKWTEDDDEMARGNSYI